MVNLVGVFITVFMFFVLPLHAGENGNKHYCKRMGQKLMMSADLNEDGSVDKDEATKAFNKHFDEMDANQDGVLSPDEVRKNHGKHHGKCSHHKKKRYYKGSQAFSNADKDDDGTLDREEAKNLKIVYKNFDAIDIDNDGTVDREEIQNFMSQRRAD